MVEWQTDKEIAILVFYSGLSTCQLNAMAMVVECSPNESFYGILHSIGTQTQT